MERLGPHDLAQPKRECRPTSLGLDRTPKPEVLRGGARASSRERRSSGGPDRQRTVRASTSRSRSSTAHAPSIEKLLLFAAIDMLAERTVGPASRTCRSRQSLDGLRQSPGGPSVRRRGHRGASRAHGVVPRRLAAEDIAAGRTPLRQRTALAWRAPSGATSLTLELRPAAPRPSSDGREPCDREDGCARRVLRPRPASCVRRYGRMTVMVEWSDSDG